MGHCSKHHRLCDMPTDPVCGTGAFRAGPQPHAGHRAVPCTCLAKGMCHDQTCARVAALPAHAYLAARAQLPPRGPTACHC
jgi:hypothetical protein